MQTILGANGSIGRLLAYELVRYTDKIRLVSRNPHRVNETDELFPADLSQPGTVDRAVKGSDVVYLIVGFDYDIKVWENKWPALMRDTINACIKHNARLVFFDNIYLYGESEIPHMTEESKVNPPSRKGRVRKHISEMLWTPVREGKLIALIARSADFYGPDLKTSIVSEMVVKNLASGKSAMWFINTGARHSFTFTPDAARATALLGNTLEAYGQVWHLPTDSTKITAGEFIDMIATELNVRPRLRILSMLSVRMLGLFMQVMKEMSEMMYQYDCDYFFDSSKFVKRFGIEPTSYCEGIREMCKGYLILDHKSAA